MDNLMPDVAVNARVGVENGNHFKRGNFNKALDCALRGFHAAPSIYSGLADQTQEDDPCRQKTKQCTQESGGNSKHTTKTEIQPTAVI